MLIQPDKYIIGAPENILEEKIANQVISQIKKLKKKRSGYLEKYNLFFFKLLKSDTIINYIEVDEIISASKIVVITNTSRNGKIYNCKRFVIKEEAKIVEDYNDGVLCFRITEREMPGPSLMFAETLN